MSGYTNETSKQRLAALEQEVDEVSEAQNTFTK